MTDSQSELIARRESAMNRADRALDKAWPKRLGEDYVREMQSAAKDLESIVEKMHTFGVKPVETSRTYRYIASIYSDLEPALGKQMLTTAMRAYSQAEIQLEGQDDALEHAKLDFNFGNLLRQFDPNDIDKLREAERRFLSARQVFAEQSPQHLAAVDEALSSTRSLLKIAPVALAVDQGRSEMEVLEKELAAGGNVAEIGAKMREIREREGGAAAMYATVQALINELPESAKQGEKYHKLTENMDELTSLLRDGEGSTDSEEREIMRLLRDKLDEEANAGRVTRERAKTMSDLLSDFGKTLGGGDDVASLMKRVADMREKAAAQFENLHYLSHGIDRPPGESRAAQLVELCWALRLFLLEEMNQRGKSDGESKLALDFNIRAASVDKRIYLAGDDDAQATIVDQEALRPFALEIRHFAARHHAMLANPIWSGAAAKESTSAVLYAGPSDGRKFVDLACKELGLTLLSSPTGKSIAASRWEQLQKAYVTIFDLRAPAGPDRAAVAYELGIARTLGKPVIVLAQEDQNIPFDVDVQPLLLNGTEQDSTALCEAVDRASVWTMPRPRSGAETAAATIDEILGRYPIPQSDTYVDQTLKQLQRLRADPDPVAVTSALKALVSFAVEDDLMLIHPAWPPTYPDSVRSRLFHVMPFRPEWADAAAARVESACAAANADYVRGDRVKDANIIGSIWKEISQASHVLVDLTDFNENVALELGIAHTLGRPTVMVGQGDTVERLFPMIAKLRFYPYENVASPQLGASVEALLG